MVAQAAAIAERSEPNPRAAILPEPSVGSARPRARLRRGHRRGRCRHPRRGGPRGHRGGPGRGPGDGRVLRDLDADRRRGELEGYPGRAPLDAGDAAHGDDGWLRVGRRVRVRAGRLARRRRHRRCRPGRRGSREGRPHARRHRARGGRVRGRARGVRRVRPDGVPVVHRLLGPGARGGALLHGAREPGHGRQRLDLGRRRRSVRHARADRLRGRRPPACRPHREWRRQGRGARCRDWRARRDRLDRARSARPEPLRPDGA